MKFSVTLTTIAFFLIFGTRGSLTAQITPLFEKIIPWGRDTSAIAIDIISPIPQSLILLTQNKKYDGRNTPPTSGYETLGSGIIEVDKNGEVQSKSHFSTYSINPSGGLHDLSRNPARHIYQASPNQVIFPFSIHQGVGFCLTPTWESKYMLGTINFRLDSIEKSYMSTFVDTETCEDYTSICLATSSNRHYFLYVDEYDLVQTIGVSIRDKYYNTLTDIFFSDKFFMYSKEYKVLYDQDNGAFIFYGYNTVDSNYQLVCLDTLGNQKWETIIPEGSYDIFVDIEKHPSGYVLSKMKDEYIRDFTSHIYLISEQGELLASREFPESVITEVEVGSNGTIFGIDDYFFKNGFSDVVPSYAILTLSPNLQVIGKKELGESYIYARRIVFQDENYFWITGAKYNTVDPTVRKPTNIYLLKARLDLPEATCSDLSTYPNPVDDHLTLETPLNLLPGERYTARLYDLTGRVIQRYPELQDPARLDMSQISNGIYLLEVGEAGGNPCLRKKIVVSHE